MYDRVQKSSSSWNSSPAQKKKGSKYGPRTFTAQPRRDTKSAEQKERPAYSGEAADKFFAKFMRSMENDTQRLTETQAVKHQSKQETAVSQQTQEVEIQKQCKECQSSEQPLAIEEVKDSNEMLSAMGVQAKPTFDTLSNQHEQEANGVAQQVVDKIHRSPSRKQNLQLEERKPNGRETKHAQRQTMLRAADGAGKELSSKGEIVQQATKEKTQNIRAMSNQKPQVIQRANSTVSLVDKITDWNDDLKTEAKRIINEVINNVINRDENNTKTEENVGFEEIIRGLVEKIYMEKENKSRQMKFPLGESQTKTIKERIGTNQPKLQEKRKYTGEEEQILQQLRWISTTLLKMLHDQNKTVKEAEVQALWDGQTIYLTANAPKSSELLDKWLKQPGYLEDTLNSMVEKEHISSGRQALRHPARLSNALKNTNNKKVVMEALKKHLKHMRNMKKDSEINKETGVKVIIGKEEMHAEANLVKYMLEKEKTNTEKQSDSEYKTKNLYVSGAKRPCFACFGRLMTAEKEYTEMGNGEGKLYYNKHMGLLWPSGSAFKNMSEKEKITALKLIGLEPYILDVKENVSDDKKKPSFENLKKHLETYPYNLTNTKKESKYGCTTPSETSENEEIENEMDQEEERKKNLGESKLLEKRKLGVLDIGEKGAVKKVKKARGYSVNLLNE